MMINVLNIQYEIEIPAGYKTTEVGVIPEDWKIAEIGALISDMRGGAPFKPSDFTKEGIMVLPKGAVVRGGLLKLSESDQQFCTPEFAAKFSKNSVTEVFTIVVLRDLVPSGPSIGLMVKIPEPAFYILAQGVYGFTTSKRLISNYLIHYSNTSNYRRAVNEVMVGSTQVHITNNAFKSLKIPLPIVAEQIAIARVLSDTDALIASLEQLITKKKAIKTASMQQLLTGRTRLPQFSKYPDGTVKGYKTSEQGQIPEDWDYVTIGEFTDCTAGGTPLTSKQSYWGGTNPWMSSGELHLRQVYDVAERITDEGLANSSTKYIPKKSVLIGLAGQGKTRGTVAIARISLCTNQSIASIFPSDRHSAEYLYYNLDSRYEELRSLSTGDGGRGGLNLKIIRALMIPFPNLHEQTVIATILSDMDAEIVKLEKKLSKARDIKQGMMQQLLTGRIRLPLDQQP